MLLLRWVSSFSLSTYIPTNCTLLVKKITYFENEVLCKDTLVSHSSNTTHTKGYAWNATTKEDTAVVELNTKMSLFIHEVTVRVSEWFTFWIHPSHSLVTEVKEHLLWNVSINWLPWGNKSRDRCLLSRNGKKKLRSHCGVSYRLDCCHLFEGVSQQSTQCQLNIPLQLSCDQPSSVWRLQSHNANIRPHVRF